MLGPLMVAVQPPASYAGVGILAQSTSIVLAFAAGFADTLGFIALFGFFTAHVTGNFALLGAAIVNRQTGLTAKLLALPTFMLAVAVTRLFERALDRHRWRGGPLILLAEGTFLLMFLVFGVWASPVADNDAPLAVLAALCGVVAMGIQNAAAKSVFSDLSPTTVMTGNVTQIVLDSVDPFDAREPGRATAIRARDTRVPEP